MKKILIISFHFPPSSGAAVQRILSLCEDLPQLGWKAAVLTANIRSYEAVENSQKIPEKELDGLFRAWAVDAHRHLSIKGKHLGILSVLDRWSSWIIGAIIKGRKIVKTQKPDIIMSTTPIPSANIIASYLSKKYSIPWVADFQDPLSYHYTELNNLQRKAQKYIDKLTMENCSASIFATENAMQSYLAKFGFDFKSRFHVIENGFIEKNWREAEQNNNEYSEVVDPQKTSILYSGALYPDGRDPSSLFKAISFLKTKRTIDADNFELVFQGVSGEAYYEQVAMLEIGDIVKFTPPVGYIDSLSCMKKAEVLLVIQGSKFNLQVPGKVYEYMRAGKLILALTPSSSATAKVTKRYPGGYVADDENEIVCTLEKLVNMQKNNFEDHDVNRYSRYYRNIEFVSIFNHVIKNYKHD